MRVALILEYKGTNYFGWQKQKVNEKKTIQYFVDNAISKIANHKIITHCGGRTDTGVHAYMQVIHFDTNTKRGIHNWTRGINSFLPNDISVKNVYLVDESFHARFSVVDRTYRYIILNRKSPITPFNDNFLHITDDIDIEKISKSFPYIIGRRDMSSFRGAGCASPSPIKHIKTISIKRKSDFIIIDIKANSFLYHMVRNLVGFFLDIGKGKVKLQHIKKLIDDGDRRKLGISVDAKGLYLLKINYPSRYKIKLDESFKISI